MRQMRKIAVAGATGTVGHQVVDLLENAGHQVVRISRTHGVDVLTRAGLEEALNGVDCIIDAASGASPDQHEATDFFRASAESLHAAGLQAGVSHIVGISILGIDRFTTGYNVAKIEHEKALLAGPIPVSILRATQFHPLVERMVDWGRQGDVSYVMRARTQLIAPRTVAEALAQLAVQPESSPLETHQPGMYEIAGPREENLADAARRLMARKGDPIRIEEVSNSDDPDQELYESGALLPGPTTLLAGPTFDQWLETTYATSTASTRPTDDRI